MDAELDPQGRMDPAEKAKIVDARYKAHFAGLAYQKAMKKHLAQQGAGSSVAADEPADETPQDPSTDKEEGSR